MSGPTPDYHGGDGGYHPPPGEQPYPSDAGDGAQYENRMPKTDQHARYDDRDRYAGQQLGGHPEHAPSRTGYDANNPPYFPPPPRSDYDAGSGDPAYEQGAPLSHTGGAPRPYAPSEPRPNEGNMLAPYDEEKAYAEYTDAYGPPLTEQPQQRGHRYEDAYGPVPGGRLPPPPSDAELRYGERRYDDRRGHDPRSRPYDDRRDYDDRSDYDDRRDSRPPRSSRDGRDRRHSDRERERRSPQKGGKDILRQGNGDRGLASTLLGGAAGAFLGHEAYKDTLGTLGGLVLGGIGGNAIEKQHEKYKERKREDRERTERRRSPDTGSRSSRPDDRRGYSRDGERVERRRSPDSGSRRSSRPDDRRGYSRDQRETRRRRPDSGSERSYSSER